MASMDIPIEINFGQSGTGEIVLAVDFEYRSGSPAHMGSLTYAGHDAEPAEIEIETIYWPVERENVADHIEMPWSGLPQDVMEAIEAHIIENYADERDETDF